jgi:hypothetical protein
VSTDWTAERNALLGRRISDLGLSLRNTVVEKLVEQLYRELAARGLAFRPPVYLSDEWGCPEGTPLIGVPFYLVDSRLSRIEEEHSGDVETEADMMRYLRHEAGHAFNYAYRLYDRADWHRVFGPYSRPYKSRFRVDPFSREYVRHILGWYAQKHPDEDFAETFAVWLTPDVDWRRAYADWPAARKLEYIDQVMQEIGSSSPTAPSPTADDLPVEAMHYTLAEHYADLDERLPIEDEQHFDGDLENLFSAAMPGDEREPASVFLYKHRREIVSRITYWTGESPAIVRAFVDFLTDRAARRDLRVRSGEANTLIELTAFGTAVIMNYRHTHDLDGASRASADT